MSDGMSEMAREEATKRQVGGDHYRKYAIQPAEYNARNGLSFLAGNVIKYVTRYKDKGGAQDIHKAMHYLELILEFEYPALLSNNKDCQPKPTAVEAPGAAIGTPAATTGQLDCPPGWEPCPGGYKSTNGPSLILKLESEDPDTIGELEHGSVRSHQEGCDAQGSRQEAGSAHHSV